MMCMMLLVLIGLDVFCSFFVVIVYYYYFLFTFTTLLVNSADNKLEPFILIMSR